MSSEAPETPAHRLERHAEMIAKVLSCHRNRDETVSGLRELREKGEEAVFGLQMGQPDQMALAALELIDTKPPEVLGYGPFSNNCTVQRTRFKRTGRYRADGFCREVPNLKIRKTQLVAWSREREDLAQPVLGIAAAPIISGLDTVNPFD